MENSSWFAQNAWVGALVPVTIAALLAIVYLIRRAWMNATLVWVYVGDVRADGTVWSIEADGPKEQIGRCDSDDDDSYVVGPFVALNDELLGRIRDLRAEVQKTRSEARMIHEAREARMADLKLRSSAATPAPGVKP
jgi:hypothetical protein